MSSDFFWRSPWPLPPSSAPTWDCGVCDEHLTGWAGLGVGARRARFRGLPASLAAAVRRQRGCRAAQRLLAGDGPVIKVQGRLCEYAERGYHGERQSWLHSVFAGPAWVSARLPAGGPDGQGDGREPLDRAAAPLLAAPRRVGLWAASASSGEALGSCCRQRGGDDAVSGTDPRQKAPLLRQAAARELREDEGEPLHPESRERAVAVAHQPARGPEEQVDVVVRRDGDEEQRLLVPVSTVMLVSQGVRRRWSPRRALRSTRGPPTPLAGN